MAESFSRWESDPLFSAAEVVQDSADRVEYVFRTLLHEQSVSQGASPDPKLLSLMRYHRRDLATALETTKWQLEDFERAVNFAASSDNSSSREHAISRHRQFIRAIRELIVQVEKTMEDASLADVNRNVQSVNSTEKETDKLALFLSGVDPEDQSIAYDPGNSIMTRFLGSTTESDEIVELKAEEAEPLPINGLKNSDYNNDSSKDYTWEDGANDLEACGSGATCYSYKNTFKGSIWRFLRNFWVSNVHKEEFTKRRKDGELVDEFVTDKEQKMLSSTFNTRVSDLDKHVWLGWISNFRLCRGLNLKGLINATQSYNQLKALPRRFQRSGNLFLHHQFLMWIVSAVSLILIVLGVLTFYRA